MLPVPWRWQNASRPRHTPILLRRWASHGRTTLCPCSVITSIENRKNVGRVENRFRRAVGLAYPLTAPFVWRCLTSRTVVIIVTCPPSSNRACSFPAHGFPMFFMPRHAPSASPRLWEFWLAHSAGTDPHSGNGLRRSLCLSPCGASSNACASAVPHGS